MEKKKIFLRDGQCFTKPLMIMSFEVEDNDVEETQVVKKLTAGFFLGITLVILTENTYAVPLQ